MTYALLATNLAAFGLLAYVLHGWRHDHADTARRVDAREVSHRQEIAQLNQARMEETADLLQRIQAPEQAVASHVAETAPPDPPPLNLDNDLEMIEEYERRMRNAGVLDG